MTAARGQPTLDAIMAAGTSVNTEGDVDSKDCGTHTPHRGEFKW